MDLTFAGPNPDGDFQWSAEAGAPRSPDELSAALETELARIASSGGGRVQLWLPEVDDSEDAHVAQFGFEPYRDLWQLQCPLPLDPTDIAVRGFEPRDADGFIEANNLAFSWHPEQSGMTAERLAETQAQDWYDPAGFLIHERDGRVAAFNWTKEHRDVEPNLGEIYVIAVHPDFQGLGLGKAMTLAGMAHLHGKGLNIGMLYVESDNTAANATYAKVGFTRHHTNRAYAVTV